jgi:hypothetical protein
MRNHLFIGAAVAALMIPAAASAQETTSAISGTVTDNGAPVADATVKITNTGNNSVVSVTTDSNGSFNASGLNPGGPYTVEVTSPSGSKTVTDVYTVVQQTYQLPIELAANGASSGDIVIVATSIKGAGVTSDGPQSVLTAKDISKVASVNRDVRDIERRDPFASIDLSNSGDRGGAVSFGGVNPRFNRFTINGVTVGDTFGLNQDASPTIRGPVPFDALSQVSVSIAPYDFRQSDFQGGAVDTVLKSGTNKFHGTGFYSINTDNLSGDQIKDRKVALPKFTSKTYGATLSGPIIPNVLFFMVSGERNTDPRPFSTLAPQVPGLTQGIIDNITSIAKTKYNIDAGSVLTINPRKDEKIVGRIDFNPIEGQRLSFSYINSYDVQVSPNNTSTSPTAPQYGLSTNAYTLSELLRAGILQWNADWSDKFSSEARLIYKWNRRGQEPLGGRPNGMFSVCNDATNNAGDPSKPSLTGCSVNVPKLNFGPDNFRQTNQLFFDTWSGQLLLRYNSGGHKIQGLFEATENRTFNNFVPNSLGAWYFDSLADFQAGKANSLSYAAVIGGDPLGAAADFHYTKYVLGLQDEWKVSDALTVTAGARGTMYAMNNYPVLNPYFSAREGFTNLKTYKGQFTFEPRISFNYKPTASRLRVRGGVGVFAGGSPDIYLSNSFSNTITTNSQTFFRDATCNTAGSLCDLALNNVTGQIPAAVAATVGNVSGNTLLPKTNTGALAPNFKLPKSLKATLSADYKLFGFDVGVDYYYGKTLEGVMFTDARSMVIGTLPDGRLRYTSQIAANDSNYDILVTNTTKGRSHIGVFRVSKTFDWGLSLFGSYTRQSVKDVSSATSSTINSNYRYQLFGADPNSPVYGISDNQIKWSFKYSVGFDHAFFGDYRTAIQLFGETRAGRPYSYTMFDPTTSRSPVFGTSLTSSVGTNLLYVPTSTTDARVSYDSEATKNALDAFINGTNLSKYRGQIAPKNTAHLKPFTQIDLHLEQEIPTFVGKSRITLFADINNLPNLINKNWGGLYQIGFPPVASVVTVQCLTAPTATGTAPGAGVVNTSSTQTCAQYRYSSFKNPNQTLNTAVSLYAIRVGARFTF